MVNLEMMMFYDENADFKRYVDENAKSYHKSPAYIMDTPTAMEYYKSLLRGGCNERRERGDINE